MIKPFYSALAAKVAEKMPKVLKGSLRHYPAEIDANTALVVPVKFSANRDGLLPSVVQETYEIHLFEPIASNNPFNNLVNKSVDLAAHLRNWLPDNWDVGVSFKELVIESITFDTAPDAGDAMGFLVSTITITVVYFSTG